MGWGANKHASFMAIAGLTTELVLRLSLLSCLPFLVIPERLSEVMNEVNGNSLSTCTKSGPSPLSPPNGKLTLASPKRGPKREEGWKEVVRR